MNITLNQKYQNYLFKACLTVPFWYWIYRIFLTDLGADPAKSLNHKTGEMSYYFLMANLIIGVLIALKIKMPSALRFLYLNRRFLGVITFFYLILHLTLYFAMESFEFKAIEQIYTKLYLILGFSAWILFLILALTSNDFSVKKLTVKKWKWLHRSVYLGFILASIHVLKIEKTDLIKYSLLAGFIGLIQTYRFVKSRRKIL
jgi:methionine sulfoxide reductase heme-binding subunit